MTQERKVALVTGASRGIGAAIAPKDGLSLEALMEHADKAMYQNKRERKRSDSLSR